MIDDREFHSLNVDQQNKILVDLATNSLPVLAKYKMPLEVAKRSIESCLKSIENKAFDAKVISINLNHPDPDLDLSAQYSFIDDDSAAELALDIVCFATGAVANAAYRRQNLDHMPESVALATPDVTVGAIDKFKTLSKLGLVENIGQP